MWGMKNLNQIALSCAVNYALQEYIKGDAVSHEQVLK